MREWIVEAARRAFSWLHGLAPKADHAVLWGWPDNEDSVLALERGLQDTPVRRVIVLVSDRSAIPPEPFGPKTRRVRKASPAGLVWFLTARYVFFTHRCYTRRFPDDVVSVNVWHGMPVKRIGWMLDGDTGIASRYAVATSTLWAPIVEEALGPTERALVTGLPRNDRFEHGVERVRGVLDVAPREHLVVWLPTYRRSIRGMRALDGVDHGTPFAMPGVDPEALDVRLAELGMTVVLKPHPMAAGTPSDRSHLRIIDDAWLGRAGLSLYPLLGAADVLITDFSSVVVDFALLDRPVIHAIADFEEYRRSRGFSIEPVEDLLAGPVATDIDQLVALLADIAAGHDPHAAQRRLVRRRCHDHLDAAATSRLLASVGLGRGPV